VELEKARAELEPLRADAARAESERALRRTAEDERNEAQDRVASLERDLKRALETPAAAPAPVDDGEKDKLRAEIERLKAQSAPQDPALGESVTALSDALAELRSSLRAASDEAAVLPSGDSSRVIGDALSAATEQIENARGTMRTLSKLLGHE
jgi:hypothetical protein